MRLPSTKRADEARDTRVDVHHRAAREVESAHLPDVTGGGVRRVDDVQQTCTHPDRPRTTPCARPAGSAKVNQITRNSRMPENFTRSTSEPMMRHAVIASERRLEAGEHDLVHRRRLAERRAERERAGGRIEQALHEEPVGAADEGVTGGEGERITVDAPEHREQREAHEHLHQDRQHVLRADQAAVEQSEAGHGHEQHQRGGE